MWDTNDAKSPRSPLRAVAYVSDPPRAYRKSEQRVPVVGLGPGRLLVSEKPAMAVRGVDDVEVAPLQRPSRWGQRG